MDIKKHNKYSDKKRPVVVVSSLLGVILLITIAGMAVFSPNKNNKKNNNENSLIAKALQISETAQNELIGAHEAQAGPVVDNLIEDITDKVNEKIPGTPLDRSSLSFRLLDAMIDYDTNKSLLENARLTTESPIANHQATTDESVNEADPTVFTLKQSHLNQAGEVGGTAINLWKLIWEMVWPSIKQWPSDLWSSLSS